jgi:hypothetical protein
MSTKTVVTKSASSKRSTRTEAAPESGRHRIAARELLEERQGCENAALSPVNYPRALAEHFADDTLRALLFRAAGGIDRGDSGVAATALETLAKELHLVTWQISNDCCLGEQYVREELAHHVAGIASRADAWGKLDELVRRAERSVERAPSDSHVAVRYEPDGNGGPREAKAVAS